MCTVTYLPLADRSWLLTANRDESPSRPANPPAVHTNSNLRLLYPQDMQAGGSWIGISEKGKSGCILNGAFKRHERKPPYRKSRGLILLDFLSADSDIFFKKYDMLEIEPFTMVGVDNDTVYEFRWDGMNKYLSFPDSSKPQLWASATLYTPEWIEKRHQWFNSWLTKNPTYTHTSILDFHLHAGEGNPEYDLVMNRYNLVRTLSVTSIEKGPKGISMLYHDLLNPGEMVVVLSA